MKYPDDFVNKVICGDCLDNRYKYVILRACLKDNIRTQKKEQEKYQKKQSEELFSNVLSAINHFGENLMTSIGVIINSVAKNVILYGKKINQKLLKINQINQVKIIQIGKAESTTQIKDCEQAKHIDFGDYPFLKEIGLFVKSVVQAVFIFTHTILNHSLYIPNLDLI